MKEFFEQCMKDLFALTGIEQVRWMQNDLANGKRDFEICVEAMVQAGKQFPYIPDADQQKIIRRMMVEDRNYKGLNSRTIWGWLDAHKGIYFRGQSHNGQQEPDRKVEYNEYLKMCKENNMTPLPETEYDKPVSAEQMAVYVAKIQQNLTKPTPTQNQDTIKDPLVALMKEQLGVVVRPEQKRLRARYIQDNYEIDGVKKDGWVSFDDWLMKNYKPPCQHTGLRIEISDTEEVCNNCGKVFPKAGGSELVSATE